MDIHSHILPGVDDGSSNVEESIELLNIMKSQGITDVIATPHFDASVNNIDDFKINVSSSLLALNERIKDMDLPNIYLGSEVFYFKGIGKSYGVKELTIAGSKYILLELKNDIIDKSVLDDIYNMIYELGLIPIFAHIERYYCERGFKKLLKMISGGMGYIQINAQSVLQAPYKRVTHKLIKQGYASFIATDTHSVSTRPPYMAQALQEINRVFGEKYYNVFIKNTEYLYNDIFGNNK